MLFAGVDQGYSVIGESMRRRLCCPALAVLIILAACPGMAGCYRRVVRADGVTGDQTVYEPNLKADKTRVEVEAENLLFGEQKPIQGTPR